MNENNGKADPEQGLYRKYEVKRLNDTKGKHRDCIYFVLDLDHDQHAVAALEAYAQSCEDKFPGLAFDLRHTAAATARKLCVDTPRPEAVTIDPGTEKILRTLLDRAYAMMAMSGYRVAEVNADHNNPIIAWMSDAAAVLYGSGRRPDPVADLQGTPRSPLATKEKT